MYLKGGKRFVREETVPYVAGFSPVVYQVEENGGQKAVTAEVFYQEFFRAYWRTWDAFAFHNFMHARPYVVNESWETEQDRASGKLKFSGDLEVPLFAYMIIRLYHDCQQ